MNKLLLRSQVSVAIALGCVSTALAATDPLGEYLIYAGNTHSHTAYTWSHGAQWAQKPTPKMSVVNGTSKPNPANVLKTDWQNEQGPPAVHFARAKEKAYDFYFVTDHSQEEAFQPVSATNKAWQDSRKAAAAATTNRFLGLTGFEYSENNGPGGLGHINVFNTAEYLNALAEGCDLPHLYSWLKTARSDGDGPVVASFNHPSVRQYAEFAGADAAIADIITLFEVINSNNKVHYDAFLAALEHGWKVSPVCGNDNHGLDGISRQTSRTFVLASSLTKAEVLDAMKHRRTYASLDRNIQCRYRVNGAIMGSTLERPTVLKFDILVSDPDTTQPDNQITKIDIVKEKGEVVQTYTPTPGHTVHWTPTVEDTSSRYFFVRVWNAKGGDAAGADPAKPVAWLAPVWTGR